MEWLHVSLEGERRRIEAYYSVQYVLITCSKEDPYRMLVSLVRLAPAMRTNLLDSDEDAFDQVLQPHRV